MWPPLVEVLPWILTLALGGSTIIFPDLHTNKEKRFRGQKWRLKLASPLQSLGQNPLQRVHFMNQDRLYQRSGRPSPPKECINDQDGDQDAEWRKHFQSYAGWIQRNISFWKMSRKNIWLRQDLDAARHLKTGGFSSQLPHDGKLYHDECSWSWNFMSLGFSWI